MTTENPPPDRGKRIEVHLTDSDRFVEITLNEALDGKEDELADELVRALAVDDPGDAERQLESGLETYGSVRRGP